MPAQAYLSPSSSWVHSIARYGRSCISVSLFLMDIKLLPMFGNDKHHCSDHLSLHCFAERQALLWTDA